MVNFIHQYYIDQDPIDTKTLKWIRKYIKNLDTNDSLLDKYGMSGEEFLIAIFIKIFIIATLKKSLYVGKGEVVDFIFFQPARQGC